MNLVSQTAYDYWHRIRVKNSAIGWLSRNAPCCEHRGQKPDKRGRGGMKIDPAGAIVFHCFNCNYTASYTPGKPIYPKFEKMLLWLGVDSKTISQLKLECLRESQDLSQLPALPTLREIKPVEMPESFLLKNNVEKFSKHVEFIKSRGFTPDDFPFLTSLHPEFRSRVILPFIRHNVVVGYSARSINPLEKVRYLMRTTTDFVFGMENAEPEYEWIILTEGLFDAMSVKGLAVMHNEISDAQAEMVYDLKKRVIVVPHLDYAGLKPSPTGLIDTALDYGWNVCFPAWEHKDINAAYAKYGPLACVQHILQNTTDDSVTIKVKQKLLLGRLK